MFRRGVCSSRRVAGWAVRAGLIMLLVGLAVIPGAQGQHLTAAASSTRTATAAPASCSTSWPTTAKGYEALWAKLDPAQWGAADLSVSVPLPDGRVVWLYGDTFSTGRFVHSTAIVQSGSCLHVSHAGAQLVPNDNARRIYWLQGGRAVAERADGTNLVLTARSVRILDPTDPWGFADGGFSREARAHVDDQGDVTFIGWGRKRHTAEPDPGPMVVFGAHHFGYSIQHHTWAQLEDGRTLTTVAQNYDDGKVRPASAYRPIWMATDGTRASVVEAYG